MLKPDLITGRSVRLATLAMATLATFAIELAIADRGHPPILVLASASALLIAPMLLGAWWSGSSTFRPSRGRTTSTTEMVAIVFLMISPFVFRPILIALGGGGSPLEVVLLASLRNLNLGLAALGHRPSSSRLAAIVSLFLILVASSMGEGALVLLAVGAYSVAGALWLTFAYWERLMLVAREDQRSNPPALAMIAWATLVAVLVGIAVAVGPSRAATILGELVPSSGGTGANAPDAQGGVNDGDNEVAASKDPRSIGFTDSEVYLESDRPSLYDSFSDMYGEPIKPRSEQQKMVAMAPQEGEQKERPTENLHAARSFPTVRQRPNHRKGEPADRAAQALFYVKGETPLHLALMTYDRFDGVNWLEEPISGMHCPLERVPGGKWLKLDRSPPKAAAGLVAHQIKIGTLDSSALPVPAHLQQFRVGSVDRPEFFGWAQEGLLRMVGRTVPAGTTIDSETWTIDRRRIRGLNLQSARSNAPSRYLEIPSTLDPAVPPLVRSWVEGIPSGWGRIEAVVTSLRGHCSFDQEATAPGGCPDVVGHFLLGSHRGPDHHFASAAAVAIRLLGYPTRVVSGYHASPRRYDPESRQTPVVAEDVHFWVEVLLTDGTWVAVEPTPGYELMGPALSVGERLLEALLRGWTKLKANALVAILGVILGLVILIFRRAILDRASTARWWVATRRDTPRRVVRTLALLDQRSRRARIPRPPGRTPARWYVPLAIRMNGSAQDLKRLTSMADWVCYARETSGRPSPWSNGEVRSTCDEAIRVWTLKRLGAHRRSFSSEVI